MTLVNVENILNKALIPQHLTQNQPIFHRAEAVKGVFDRIVSTVLPRNEVTSKRNLVFLPKSVENFIGELSYSSLVNSSKGKSLHAEKKALLEQVKNTLLPRVRREFNWDIQLVSSKSVNAAALPGGKIIVCEGIIDEMIHYLRSHMDEVAFKLSQQSVEVQAEVLGKELQSMLAAVVSHEIAHADIGHTRSALQATIIFNVLILIAYFLVYTMSFGAAQNEKTEANSTQPPNPLSRVAEYLNKQLFDIAFGLYQLARSRGAEYEADAMGMQVYMHEAGYDLNGAVRLMDMFNEKHMSSHLFGGLIEKIQEIFATHPLSYNRKVQAEEIRDRVQGMQQPRAIPPVPIR